MKFTVGSKEDIIKAAEQAEYTGGNFVKEPGAYFGPIENFVFRKFDSGAGGVEVTIKTEEGLSCKVMLITMAKSGSSTYKNAKGEQLPLPGVNQITGGIMPILQVKELNGTEDKDGNIVYQSVIGRKLGMLVNIRKTLGKKNRVYENADLKAFFCPLTDRTGSEIMAGIQSGQGTKKAKLMEGLCVIDETAGAQDESAANNASDPFGDAGATDGAADPFASDSSDSSADPFANDSAETKQEEPKQEAKEEAKQETPAAKEEQKVEETPAASNDADDFWN